MFRSTPTYAGQGRSAGGWSPLEAALRRSADVAPATAAKWVTLTWCVLIAIDGVTGPHFSLNALYLVPLCFTTWCLGRLAGMAAGGMAVSATLWLNGFGDGLSAQASTVPMATAAWNAGMRVFAVAFVILFVSAFRRTFDRERQNARVDPLTGLGNRRSFRSESRRLELAAGRDRRILLCGLIDVDDFKGVNDRLGHAEGDEVLRVVARSLSSALRPYDVTARLGGDEFVFCLAVRDEAAAERKTEEIHGAVAEALAASGRLATCSLGATTGFDVATAMERADAMMYYAKAAGKGTWRFAAGAGSGGATGPGLPALPDARPEGG